MLQPKQNFSVEKDEEGKSLVSGTTVFNKYEVLNRNTGLLLLVVVILVIINIALSCALVGISASRVTNENPIRKDSSKFENAPCVNLCSPACVGVGAECFDGCYTACNDTATAMFVRPAVLGNWLEPNAIQHVGVTTSNLTRSVKFYTEVMGGVEVNYAGGDGWNGDDVYQLLMQKALMGGSGTAKWAANLSTGGPETLSARYINFGSMVIELLDYFSVEAKIQRSMEFPKFSDSNAAPSVAQNMHFSFNIHPQRDLDEFVNALEAQSHRLGYNEVVCNRLVPVSIYAYFLIQFYLQYAYENMPKQT